MSEPDSFLMRLFLALRRCEAYPCIARLETILQEELSYVRNHEVLDVLGLETLPTFRSAPKLGARSTLAMLPS